MPGEAGVALHEAFGPHVFEAGFFHQGEGGLGELRGGEEAGGGAVGVAGGVFGDFFEDALGFDGAVGVDGFEGHGHVVLTDGFAARAAKVDGEFFGVVFDDVGNFETCSGLV